MGFGSYAAGLGPAGEDPLPPPSPPSTERPPAAIYIDLASKDARIGADGRWASMHPVDQQVCITFAYPKGSLKHAPEYGHEFLTLPRKSGVALDNEVRARALRAQPFAHLIETGAVVLDALYVTRTKEGETSIVIQYRNMRLDPTRVREIRTGP